MEVAGEGGKTALAAGRKESQDLWLSPLGKEYPDLGREAGCVLG